ncbi:ABC transporter permease subunit [Paenibacillus aurantius]|uniref:ABC transporter permease subunit n=1 Tax=Paenibacillus aurantius TaxID=2918900 RepID=A0AA96L8B8_9BACL|nr:ABC transporter permease subunit [Paenibacillus aurantius]WJH33824.1 ABC transporter permease subunit [Paenibacillus sp. CC-CFT747]WNQ08934.1 ABC transporter permease subunit [Paenibacillus aurantius]
MGASHQSLLAGASIKRAKAGNGLWFKIKQQKILLLLLVPGLLYFFLFSYVPMYGILVAFKKFRMQAGHPFWSSVFTAPWAGAYGLDYFKAFINGPYFWMLMKNTFLLGFYSILFGFPIPILFALLLNELRNRYYKSFVQTVSYLPYFLSIVAVVGMMKLMLAPDTGIVNVLLVKLGFEPIYFFGLPGWFRTLFVSSHIWKDLGMGAVIYLAALSKVDAEQYESAVLDGATRLQQMWNITLPAIKPVVVITLILGLSHVLGVGAEKIILMYSPLTYDTADVFSTYVYRQGLVNMDFSFGAAVDLFNSVINVFFLVSANYLAKKITEESLW